MQCRGIHKSDCKPSGLISIKLRGAGAGGHTGEVPADPERKRPTGTHALGCLAEAGAQPVDQSHLEDVDWGGLQWGCHVLSSVCALHKVSVIGATEG